jgi:hypothetical protein
MVTPARKCPACSAELEVGATACPFCSSQVVQVALSYQEREDVNRLMKRLHAFLISEKDRLNRTLDVIVLLVWGAGTAVLLLAWLYFVWIMNGWAFMLILTFALYLMWDLLRRSYVPKRLLVFYLVEIEPQIRQFSKERNIPRWQIDQMADFILPDESQLRHYLSGSRK